MASEALINAQNRLNAYYEAELKVLEGQSYSIGSRILTRANLQEIRDAIKYLEIRVEQLKALDSGKGRNKVFGIIPRDY